MAADLNKNVPKHWKPVAALADRKSRMAWSDRIWYWMVSIGGLMLIGVGVAWFAWWPGKRLASVAIGVGLVAFFLGSPGMAARNGYRH
jgi:hypothetical protein